MCLNVSGRKRKPPKIYVLLCTVKFCVEELGYLQVLSANCGSHYTTLGVPFIFLLCQAYKQYFHNRDHCTIAKGVIILLTSQIVVLDLLI